MGVEADAVAQAIIAASTARNVRSGGVGGSAWLNLLCGYRPRREANVVRVHIKALGDRGIEKGWRWGKAAYNDS